MDYREGGEGPPDPANSQAMTHNPAAGYAYTSWHQLLSPRRHDSHFGRSPVSTIPGSRPILSGQEYASLRNHYDHADGRALSGTPPLNRLLLGQRSMSPRSQFDHGDGKPSSSASSLDRPFPGQQSLLSSSHYGDPTACRVPSSISPLNHPTYSDGVENSHFANHSAPSVAVDFSRYSAEQNRVYDYERRQVPPGLWGPPLPPFSGGQSSSSLPMSVYDASRKDGTYFGLPPNIHHVEGNFHGGSALENGQSSRGQMNVSPQNDSRARDERILFNRPLSSFAVGCASPFFPPPISGSSYHGVSSQPCTGSPENYAHRGADPTGAECRGPTQSTPNHLSNQYSYEKTFAQTEPQPLNSPRRSPDGDSKSFPIANPSVVSSDPDGIQSPTQPHRKPESDVPPQPVHSFSSHTSSPSHQNNSLNTSECCPSPVEVKPRPSPFVVAPGVDSSGESGGETEVEQKWSIQSGLNMGLGKTVAPEQGQNITENAQATATVKEEPLLYDSSTSEYEPPSPYQVPVHFSKQPSQQKKMTLRKRSRTANFAEDSDDSEGEKRKPRIKMVIKKEKSAQKTKDNNNSSTQTRSKRSTQRSGTRAKRAGGKQAGKKANRTCPICNKTFSRADSLTCHMRVHTGDRPFRCDQCDASYKVSSHLRDHVRSKHTNSRPYECEKCGKTFTYSTAKRRHEKSCGKDLSERVEFVCTNCEKGFVTSEGYKKHKRHCGVPKAGDGAMKAEETPYKCSKCERNFATYAGLDRHQRFFCGKMLQKGNYTCEECGKTFDKRNRYITHTRHHTGEKPYKCPHCDASFYENTTLRQHVDRHEGQKKFKCSLCDSSFYDKRCLSLHVMRLHCGMKPFKCNECDADFSNKYKLSRHIRRIHRQERRFKCMVCSKAFFDSSAWMKHMRMHTSGPRKPVPRKLVKRHNCSLCNKSFFMKDMRTHIKAEHPGATLSEAITRELPRCNVCLKEFACIESMRVHQLRHTGMKPFQCDQCEKSFVLNSALVIHQRKHTDYRPHSCATCSKTFRWRASLNLHMKTYHGDPKPDPSEEDDTKRFPCHICHKEFKRQICLRVHLKRHSDVMPCICSHCGKGFVDSCRLKIHMSVHDGPKPFTCETCGAGFFYQYLLESHIKKRHTDINNQAWLCEECGKSLCRKDSLEKHMALHAKYVDGKIPARGRRKGSKFPKTVPQDNHLSKEQGQEKLATEPRPQTWREQGQERLTAEPGQQAWGEQGQERLTTEPGQQAWREQGQERLATEPGQQAWREQGQERLATEPGQQAWREQGQERLATEPGQQAWREQGQERLATEPGQQAWREQGQERLTTESGQQAWRERGQERITAEGSQVWREHGQERLATEGSRSQPWREHHGHERLTAEGSHSRPWREHHGQERLTAEISHAQPWREHHGQERMTAEGPQAWRENPASLGLDLKIESNPMAAPVNVSMAAPVSVRDHHIQPSERDFMDLTAAADVKPPSMGVLRHGQPPLPMPVQHFHQPHHHHHSMN